MDLLVFGIILSLIQVKVQERTAWNPVMAALMMDTSRRRNFSLCLSFMRRRLATIKTISTLTWRFIAFLNVRAFPVAVVSLNHPMKVVASSDVQMSRSENLGDCVRKSPKSLPTRYVHFNSIVLQFVRTVSRHSALCLPLSIVHLGKYGAFLGECPCHLLCGRIQCQLQQACLTCRRKVA